MYLPQAKNFSKRYKYDVLCQTIAFKAIHSDHRMLIRVKITKPQLVQLVDACLGGQLVGVKLIGELEQAAQLFLGVHSPLVGPGKALRIKKSSSSG